MLKKLFSSRVKKSISIYLGMHKVAICENSNGQPTLIAGEFVQSDAEWSVVIKKLVNTHSLQHHNVSVVIGKDFYQKFDIDKPKLDEKELLATLPFSIKDLVSESVFDLVVDYFDKPAQVRKGDQITVVCIAKERVVQLRELLSENTLKLVSITIEEIATCQLFEHSNEANILLSQQEGELLLSVVKSGQLYFSLRIRGYNDLLPLPLSETSNELVDGLSLEIQRALDFINSQLQINTIGALYLALQCPDIELLSSKLAAYLDKSVKPFPVQYHYDFILAYGGFDGENAE
jgi:MSHA biogenesis protein MshI